MGLYDPNNNTNIDDNARDVKINSVTAFDGFNNLGLGGLHDGLRNTLSKTNDITLGAVDRLRGWSDGLGALLSTIDDQMDTFGGILGGRIINKPNEMISKGIPPPEIYNKCSNIDGLSVWDKNGWWHCLFPRSKIPFDYRSGTVQSMEEFNSDYDSTKLLSREDIENDIDNKYGLFFRNLEDLLGWQASMKKSIADQRRKQWADWEQHEKSKWSFDDSNDNDNIYANGKTVIGRETQTSIRSLDNGDMERTIYQRRIYSDGSSRDWEKKEIVGPDGVVKEEK
jgi:hypothetical protein